MTQPKPVLISTNNRGIYYGYLVENHAPDHVTLERARVCAVWDTGEKGYLYMATHGPEGVAMVSPAVGSMEVYGVATIAECSPEAAEAWDAS
jgi:hypothetical protein